VIVPYHRSRLREYFPVHMTKGGAKGVIAKLFRSSSQPNLEGQLVIAHCNESERTTERMHLQQRYLQLCRSMSFYGLVTAINIVKELMSYCICSTHNTCMYFIISSVYSTVNSKSMTHTIGRIQ